MTEKYITPTDALSIKLLKTGAVQYNTNQTSGKIDKNRSPPKSSVLSIYLLQCVLIVKLSRMLLEFIYSISTTYLLVRKYKLFGIVGLLIPPRIF